VQTGAVDSMNFYLSDMIDRGNNLYDYRNGTRPTIIRPCRTNRGTATAAGAPATRNTIAYGNVEFYDPATGGQRTAFLYDVWIGTPTGAGGYGITFWLADSRTFNLGGYTTIGALATAAGISEAVLNERIVGYWDAAWLTIANTGNNTLPAGGRLSEWKQFYGFYTVPEGQVKTEFAFESTTSNARRGNYLDGVTFQSAAFLTVSKDAFYKGTRERARFVKPGDPGDTVTIELTVRNHGEIMAGNIEIIDCLAPFTAYLDFVPGSVRVNGSDVGFTYEYENGVLTVKPSGAISRGEAYVVTFDISIPLWAKGPDGNPTLDPNLQYYIRNQAAVRYEEAGFGNDYTGSFEGYRGRREAANASEVIRITIDPVKLDKTVDELVVARDEEFKVTLTLENTQDGTESINARGQIAIMIPQGFSLVVPPADGNVRDVVSGGETFTRVVISNVNLSGDIRKLEFEYTLKYTGEGYGVARDAVSADYTYMFFSGGQFENIALEFPQTVIGIKADPADEILTMDVTDLIPNPEIEIPAMVFELEASAYLRANAYREGGYIVSARIVLLDGDDNPIEPGTRFVTEHFIAVLTGGINQTLNFAPVPNVDGDGNFIYAGGVHELRYIVELIAESLGSDPDLPLSSGVRTITVNVEVPCDLCGGGVSHKTCPFCGADCLGVEDTEHKTCEVCEESCDGTEHEWHGVCLICEVPCEGPGGDWHGDCPDCNEKCAGPDTVHAPCKCKVTCECLVGCECFDDCECFDECECFVDCECDEGDCDCECICECVCVCDCCDCCEHVCEDCKHECDEDCEDDCDHVCDKDCEADCKHECDGDCEADCTIECDYECDCCDCDGCTYDCFDCCACEDCGCPVDQEESGGGAEILLGALPIYLLSRREKIKRKGRGKRCA
jgi:uncharacterized repeat protein (TIGR01451 family)